MYVHEYIRVRPKLTALHFRTATPEVRQPQIQFDAHYPPDEDWEDITADYVGKYIINILNMLK